MLGLLPGLLELPDGEVLQVVDRLLHPLHALLHTFEGFLLHFLILAFEDFAAVAELLRQILVLAPEGLDFGGELAVEKLEFLPAVLLAVAFLVLLPQASAQLLVVGLQFGDGAGELRALLGDLGAFGLRLLQQLLESAWGLTYLAFSCFTSCRLSLSSS